jgi:hypothetical protein
VNQLGPVVVLDAQHGRIKGINVAAELGHGLVERPLVVDAKRVDEAIVVDGRNKLIEANEFLAVWMSDSSRIAARSLHH